MLVLLAAAVLTLGSIAAAERRARPPTFSQADTRGVFFDDVTEAVRGQRPDLASLRESGTDTGQPDSKPSVADSDPNSADGDRWSKLVAATVLEDEVKRVRLQFNELVTTPGAFSSGGYQDARLQLSILAMLFGVINEFEGEVRWKDQAPVARDLIARTAANSKAGSTQVYNEAKLRQQDLQDLVSGAGLQERAAEEENDWALIVDRAPLMEYAERLLDRMQDASRNEAAMKQATDELNRDAQMLAVVSKVLQLDGMINADDEDYTSLSQEMTVAASEVAAATQRGDAEAVRLGVGAVSQSCVACHDQYR